MFAAKYNFDAIVRRSPRREVGDGQELIRGRYRRRLIAREFVPRRSPAISLGDIGDWSFRRAYREKLMAARLSSSNEFEASGILAVTRCDLIYRGNLELDMRIGRVDWQ